MKYLIEFQYLDVINGSVVVESDCEVNALIEAKKEMDQYSSGEWIYSEGYKITIEMEIKP